MKKLVYLLSFALISICSCTEQVDPPFNDNRFITFDDADQCFETHFTFTKPDKVETSHTLLIPITYRGRMYSDNRMYQVEFVPEKTTAKENLEFNLPQGDEAIFHPMKYTDSLAIRLHNSSRLNEQDLTLHIKFVDNENFKARIPGLEEFTVFISNKMRPYWWDDRIEEQFLGKYSDKKYKLFYQHIFDGDLYKLERLGKIDLNMVTTLFYDWLVKHPDEAVEEDGTPMTLA